MGLNLNRANLMEFVHWQRKQEVCHRVEHFEAKQHKPKINIITALGVD